MNQLFIPGNVGQVSDGYHSFDELYEHRCLLWVHVLKAHKDQAFKTWRNDAGETWDGWFIAGMDTAFGQITYHLPEKLWPLLDVEERTRNASYDGHTPEDTLERLRKLAATDMENEEEAMDKYAAIRKIFKDGDWVVGTNKHVGCSQVFDSETASPQPFSYLDETDPNEFRKATAREVQRAYPYIHQGELQALNRKEEDS